MNAIRANRNKHFWGSNARNNSVWNASWHPWAMVVLLRQSFSGLGKQNKFWYGKWSFGFARRFDPCQPKLCCDPGGPNSPPQTLLSRKIVFSVQQKIGGAIGDCQTKNDNAVPQNLVGLFGVEASKSDVQPLSKALMNELWKIAEQFVQTMWISWHLWIPKNKRNQLFRGTVQTLQYLIALFCVLNKYGDLKTWQIT